MSAVENLTAVASQVRCVLEAGDILGEGPFWDEARQRLWWFDIRRNRLSWFEPRGEGHGRFDLPLKASAGAARRDGALLLATAAGLAVFTPETAKLRLVHPVAMPEGFRSNDGHLDPLGRFWWSTMDDDHGARHGAIHRYDASGGTRQVLAGIHIPNSLAGSADGRTLYVSDSRRRTIFRHAVDEAGELGPAEVFAHTHGQRGVPDGSALDSEGRLWNAQWEGWRIVAYAADGSIERVIPMPVQQPTCCTFGGEGRRTLFITTAREGLTEAELARQPLAGALFALEPGAAGLVTPPFG